MNAKNFMVVGLKGLGVREERGAREGNGEGERFDLAIRGDRSEASDRPDLAARTRLDSL